MPAKERKSVILVVDDEKPVRVALAEILEDEGYRVLQAESGEEGVETALADAPDVVFLDVWLPGINGIDALRLMRERGVFAPVVMISGHGTIETAVRATKLGAYDFIEKPVSLERVLLVAGNALRHARLERRNRSLRSELRREAEYLGRCPAIERLRRDLAAATDGRPVLLHGAKGTGRRLAARWLALHGPRPDGPFLDLQASAMSRDRLIRALFGDPSKPRLEPGRLMLADEGTLYLENVDDMPPALQASLAAGIHSGTFPMPGSRRTVRSEHQLVLSIMDRPEVLAEEKKLSGAFLASIGHTIEVPTLQQRLDDLPELIAGFLGQFCREYARDHLYFTPESMAVMLTYDWPGNVRELRGVLERIVLLSPGPSVTPDDLPATISGRAASDDGGVASTLRRFEESWLRRHLDEADGDLERAASRLGISRDELVARMTRFGFEI